MASPIFPEPGLSAAVVVAALAEVAGAAQRRPRALLLLVDHLLLAGLRRPVEFLPRAGL
jgi:hypothetical protein